MNTKKETTYRVRFGHSLWSVNQLPAQEVNERTRVRGWRRIPGEGKRKEQVINARRGLMERRRRKGRRDELEEARRDEVVVVQAA